MVKNSKQSWTVGSTVKVGFLVLIVKVAIPTPGDHRPDAYLLTNLAGTQTYSFVPHHGLTKLSVIEARALVADAEAIAARTAATATARAQAESHARAELDALFDSALVSHRNELARAEWERT